MKKNRIVWITLAVLMVMLLSCATEKAPAGGPEDKTPPKCLLQTPANGSVNISHTQPVSLVFNEKLSTSFSENNITLFPIGAAEFKVSVRQKNLTIIPDPFWPDTSVFTLNINRNLKDRHGNSIENSLQLSFSTGSFIPQNQISGYVYDLEKNETAVVCISRYRSHPDSIIRYPEYYLQTDEMGYYEFNYLPKDEFFVTGYLDWDQSNSYKSDYDGICIPERPSVVSDTLPAALDILAVHTKDKKPLILSTEWEGPGTTGILASKIPAPDISPEVFMIHDEHPDTLIISGKTIQLYHKEMNADSFNISLSNFRDNAGYEMDDTSFFVKTGTFDDSLVSFDVMNDFLKITPAPMRDSLTGLFTTLEDTGSLTLTRYSNSLFFLPQGRKNGRWQINPRPVRNPDLDSLLADSVYSVRLNFPQISETGAVGGMLSDSTDKRSLRLILRNGESFYDISVTGNAFRFENVLPGQYELGYYRDTNENGRPDPGQRDPFSTPEIIRILTREIDVRARWDTELEADYSPGLEKREKVQYINRQLSR